MKRDNFTRANIISTRNINLEILKKEIMEDEQLKEQKKHLIEPRYYQEEKTLLQKTLEEIKKYF